MYSLKCFFEGGGVLLVFDICICQNLSHTSIIVIKRISIKPRIPQNRLNGYIAVADPGFGGRGRELS